VITICGREEGERIAALATWEVFVLMIIKGAAGLLKPSERVAQANRDHPPIQKLKKGVVIMLDCHNNSDHRNSISPTKDIRLLHNQYKN